MLRRPLARTIAAVIGVVVIGLVWFILQVVALGGEGRLVIVTVKPGDSMAAIAGAMHAKGVIHSPFAFRVDTLFLGSIAVQPGSYQIAQNSSFAHVKAIFGTAPNVAVVSVAPGETLHEVTLQLESDEGAGFAGAFVTDEFSLAATSPYDPNVAAVANSGVNGTESPIEGLIAPGQYVLTPAETPLELLQSMMSGFNREAASAGLSSESRIEGLSAYQLVIAASIVQREGYYEVNMPKVARVIFNRLAKGGPLQMDSTVKYPLGIDAGAVTPQMLQTSTPYNTYLHTGLTPTPICTVSTAALDAVLHAPAGSWYYFTLVSRNGTLAFSTTFAQQLANERLAASRGLG